ncbi:MAG: class I SAM-dependent DNA methyltransferase [Eubacterium sp.]
MSNYQVFASFYDRLTDNVDYKVRSSYISDFFVTNNINDGVILDLACGTCSISVPFAKKGFRLIGIDASEEMLSQASNKLLRVSDSFSLIKTEMQDFKLAELVDGCICSLDSINHLTHIEDVKKTFENVLSSLKEGGIFVFDVNTVYKHNEILADNTFVFDEDDFFLSWDNELLDDDTVRIMLDFFVFNGESYDRFSEEFCEKAYPIEVLKKMLFDVGFSDVMIYDDLSLDKPKRNSERVYFVCKR